MQRVEPDPVRGVFLQRNRTGQDQRLGRVCLAGAQEPGPDQQAEPSVLPASHADRFGSIAWGSLRPRAKATKRPAAGAAGLDASGFEERCYSRV
jgi:hypothetical protein